MSSQVKFELKKIYMSLVFQSLTPNLIPLARDAYMYRIQHNLNKRILNQIYVFPIKLSI